MSTRSQTIWVGVACLAVGYIVGNEVGKRRGGDSGDQGSVVKAGDTGKPDQPAADDPTNKAYKVELAQWTPVKGRSDAKVTIVVYSDFQWPFCSRVGPTLQQIEKTYGKDVRIAFRHQPLSFHQNAMPAAEASMAAHAQGKFWEMHDKIFANQQNLDRATFEKHAQELGLNMEKFKADLDGHKYKEQIEADSKAGTAVDANGTPTLFVNGWQIVGAQPFDAFKPLIEAGIRKADRLIKSGTRPADVYNKIISGIAAAPPPPPPQPQAPQAPPPPEYQKVELAAWTPIEGPKFSKVTIVVFSDFQWPFCSRVGPTLKQIKEKYGNDVRIAFRHQPLPFHDNAMVAAEASMAAHAQGKFWQMHDKMFENAKALDRASLDKYAQEIGLNMARFKADMDGHKHKAQIDADSKHGTAVGANGTPTLFVNGRQIVGAQPFSAFQPLIDEALKKADEKLKKGVPLNKLYEAIISDLPKAPQAAAPAAEPPPEKVDISVGVAPVKGPRTAAVTIIAFSEFQWPFCARVGPTLKQLEKDYAGKIRIAFKHQPLSFHQFAQIAAEASMAAHEQGKFWEMHDKIFDNQKAIDRPDLEKYAQELGLNMAKFKAALDTGKYKEYIKKDSEEGTKVGANGTPTFFINGYKLVGAQPVDAFKKLIDQELAKKK